MPTNCYLGVLGGMGPAASAAFMSRLAALTPAQCDQEHIPALVLNDPRIPDRSSAWLAGDDRPFEYMRDAVSLLSSAGVERIVIPCNTAHFWYDKLAAAAGCPIIHIVDAVIEDLQERGISSGRVGLMGTAATLTSGLYEQRLRAHGYECIVPTSDELQSLCMPAIVAVKANRPDLAFEPAAACVRALKARGADVVVLGCTELPLAIPPSRRGEIAVPLSDSIDALALAVVRRWMAAQEDLQHSSDLLVSLDRPGW